MILEQQIWKAKMRCKDDLVALCKAEGERMGIPYRIFTPITHPGSLVFFEFHFVDLAAQTRFWAEWNSQPEAQVFQTQLHELVEKEHRTELYRVM